MSIIFSILFVIGFISFIAPFAIWAWTNLMRAQEIFGILRLRFISYSFLVFYLILIIDIMAMVAIVLTA